MADENEYTNEIVRDVRQYAHYPTADGHADDTLKIGKEAPKEKALNLDELSAKEIDAFVNSGDLTAEQVYEHESAAEHPRKTVLNKYAPKGEHEATAGTVEAPDAK